jgi:hypothetical protein
MPISTSGIMLQPNEFCPGSYDKYNKDGEEASLDGKFFYYNGYGTIQEAFQRNGAEAYIAEIFDNLVDTDIGRRCKVDCGGSALNTRRHIVDHGREFFEHSVDTHTLFVGEELDKHICNSRSVYAMVDGKNLPDEPWIWIDALASKVVSQSPAWENVPDFGRHVGFEDGTFAGINWPGKGYKETLDQETVQALEELGYATNWILKYPRAGPQAEVCTLVYQECPNMKEVLGASLGYAAVIEFVFTMCLIPTLMMCGCISTKNSFFKDFVVSIVAEGIHADVAAGLTDANELGTPNPMWEKTSENGGEEQGKGED